MRYAVVIVSILVSILLVSCGGKRMEDGGKEEAAKGNEAGGRPAVSADSLTARVSLNEGSYALREPVVMTLTVRNMTDRSVNLTFPTAQRYDFVVRKDKEIVWQWSDEMMFAQVLGRHTIAPEDSISYEITWDQKRSDGSEMNLGAYTVTGILKASPEIASEPKQFFLAD